jgi:hypothetical protein
VISTTHPVSWVWKNQDGINRGITSAEQPPSQSLQQYSIQPTTAPPRESPQQGQAPKDRAKSTEKKNGKLCTCTLDPDKNGKPTIATCVGW